MITTQIDDLVGRPTGVKTQAFLYVLCGLAEAAVYVALLPLLRSLIAGDYVAAGYLVALAAALALLHSVIGFFADNRGYCIGIEQICHALQDALGDHIVRLPLGWFTKERSGQVAALLTKELQMAMDVPSTFLRQMVIAVTTPAAVVVLFLFVDWRIGLVFVIAAPLLLWASRAMAKAAPAASIEAGWRAVIGCSYQNSFETARAASAVNALLGSYGAKGGALLTSSPAAGKLADARFADPPKPQAKRVGNKEYPLALDSAGTNLAALKAAL